MKAIALCAFLAMAVMVYSESNAIHGDVKCPPGHSENATLIPNPYNCSSYYVCLGGAVIPMDCPKGLHFNEELGVCDWPGNANCKEIQP